MVNLNKKNRFAWHLKQRSDIEEELAFILTNIIFIFNFLPKHFVEASGHNLESS